MDLSKEVLLMLDEVLSLGGRSVSFTNDTHLIGAIPELDSMAVVALITACEERFGIVIDDDELEAATFATVGSFSEFISSKLSA
jgi:acyl carrier protein